MNKEGYTWTKRGATTIFVSYCKSNSLMDTFKLVQIQKIRKTDTHDYFLNIQKAT
jgi:hypothetical protein